MNYTHFESHLDLFFSFCIIPFVLPWIDLCLLCQRDIRLTRAVFKRIDKKKKKRNGGGSWRR